MRICLPTVNDAGLTARLSPHFGSAPFFTVVDPETGYAQAAPNAHVRHEHGACNPTGTLVDLDVDVVVCRGLGWRALATLERMGIPVYRTDNWSVGDALNAFAAHRLSLMGAEHACRQEP